MDLGWTFNCSAFWIFPLLCVLFMAIMMIARRGMPCGCCGSARGGAGGEAGRKDPNTQHGST